MSKRDSLAFAVAGLVAWGAATAFYAAFGAGLLEASFWFYCLNAFAAAGAFVFAFQGLARLLRRPKAERLAPAVIFALPGLLGGLAVMAVFHAFPPGADPASLGRYGAFLLTAYLAVLGGALEGRPDRVTGGAPAR